MTQQTVKIQAAKGRPMLTWVGKRPLRRVTAFPAQKIETYNPTGETNPGGLLLHGDNKEVLAWLLSNDYRGKVKLIYIDPPFDSGANYVRKVRLRGVTGATQLDGEAYTLGEQIQYTDIWANDNYLQFMYERLMLLKEILAEEGLIVIHINTTRNHYIKVLMDEVFGSDNFRNEIIVKRIRKSYTEASGVSSLNEGCDYLLLYAKSPQTRFIAPLKYSPKKKRWHSFDAPNIRPNLTYDLFGKFPPPGRCWMRTEEEAQKMIKKGDLRPNPDKGWPEYRLEATDYIVRDTLWNDITASAFTMGYPTEKKEQMIEILVSMGSNPDDLVLDCFIGSGTTVAVAQKLGRRWIACDINKGAIQTTAKRLQTIIQEQLKQPAQQIGTDDAPPLPAQLSFSVHRVNDYDLQIQRNEAMQLAVEHVGAALSRTDIFFDGTRGKALLKLIPFERPLTLRDLEDIKQELANRPEETRHITIVCLGQETAVDGWLEEWNRHRKWANIPNKIEVIELRTDPRYGKFFVHQPASARVNVLRQKNKLHITIKNFISPTIIERLKSQAGLLAPQIDDWRAMVDSVMIDTAYNGEVFNVTYADVPAKKNDLVNGNYTLPAPEGENTIAIKVTDMLGEEVLETVIV